MNSNTIVVTVKGVPYFFDGDELTSPAQAAILFLKAVDGDPLDE